MGELRQALTSAVREKHRESVYILALSFVPADIDEALWFDYTFERVKKRGENHQTLTPGRTVDMEGVMRRFMRDFQPVSLLNQNDLMVDEVLQLDPINESLEQQIRKLAAVVCPLISGPGGWKEDELTDLSPVVKVALDYQVTTRKEVKSSPDKIKYLGVQVRTNVVELLRDYWSRHPEHDATFFYQLLRENRISSDHLHITLMHRNQCSGSDDEARWEKIKAATMTPVTAQVVGIIWDDRVMALLVQQLQPDWLVDSTTPMHITIGTANAQVKPVESKYLIESSIKNSSTVEMVRFGQEWWNIEGIVRSFTY